MAPITTRAVLLRSHQYGDTSSILRFYTETHGLVAAMAKGIRSRSGKGTAAIASFASGTLTAWVKPQRDLHTMKDFGAVRVRSAIGRGLLRLAGASAAAELILAHTDQDPHPGLFETLEDVLDTLESTPHESLAAASVSGMWRLVDALGYAPQIERCVSCDEPVGDEDVARFDFASGGLRCGKCSEGAGGPRVGPIARSQLAALLTGEMPPDLTYPRRHVLLLSDFVAYHVTPKPLKSLGFLRDALPAGEGP